MAHCRARAEHLGLSGGGLGYGNSGDNVFLIASKTFSLSAIHRTTGQP